MRFEFRTVFEFTVLTLMFIWIWLKIIFRVPVMEPEHCKGSFRDWYEAHMKAVDIPLKVIIGGAMTIIMLTYVGPFILDVPALVSGNYEVVEGTSLSKKYKSRYPDRIIEIKDDESGEVISVEVKYDKVDKGDHVVVKYLPHSKQGKVVEHTSSN